MRRLLVAGPALCSLLVGSTLSGCAPTCAEGFYETEAGSCLRNHYGDPHGGGLIGDDTGGGGDAMPTCVLNVGTFGTDADGVDFLEVALSCQDTDGDLAGGSVEGVFDGSVNFDLLIVEGPESGEDYDNAHVSHTDLWFWLADVPGGEYTATVSVIDAAGNSSLELGLTLSDTPQ
ncbi:MAG: hypothetical protein EXR69_13260 [Myxococcales bacterium]|nr:hypothetical protein [Myxococcales bacterium]